MTGNVFLTVDHLINRTEELRNLLNIIDISNTKIFLTLEHNIALMSEIHENYVHNLRVVIGFIRGLPWIANVMVGGRLPHRSISSQEMCKSAVETGTFAYTYGAKEIILICRYLTPEDQYIQQYDNISFKLSAKHEICRILCTLLDCIKNEKCRIRVSLIPESVIPGSIVPYFPDEFARFIGDFNQSPEQGEIFNQYYFKPPCC